MKKIIFIYDNIELPNKRIKKVIGNKSYADIVLKKTSTYNKIISILKNDKNIFEITRIDCLDDIDKTIKKIKGNNINVNIIHIFSKFVVTEKNEFSCLIDKACFINENIRIEDENADIAGLMYSSTKGYINFLELLKIYYLNRDLKLLDKEITEFCSISTNTILNIENYNNFLRFITGGFDARYFNSLKTDENIVIKTSANIDKIKKEYTYYKLIPEEMKKWMVEPYNYMDNGKTASYEMERLYIPDIAIRWVHGAISPKEFENILDKVFYYIDSRKTVDVTKNEYIIQANKLYIDKLKTRIEQLKKCEEYDKIARYISTGTRYKDIDEIVTEYIKLYDKAISTEKKFYSVIGHGDLCFSNILYDDDINLMKLIDPKGAINDEELWTNPYYDIAKISHSICGQYDLFNSGKYDIIIDEKLNFKLNIRFDNEKYISVFKNYLEKKNINYNNIRIYETSLFLSMLPLHMDYPMKVFGFLLNAINIMEEIKNV